MVHEVNKKKRKISHIYITDKNINYTKTNKFYSDNDPFMKSESNRNTTILKPIVLNKAQILKQSSIKISHLKETSLGILLLANLKIEYSKLRGDSNYVNSSDSTGVSGR